jgi:hypothetical protein
MHQILFYAITHPFQVHRAPTLGIGYKIEGTLL